MRNYGEYTNKSNAVLIGLGYSNASTQMQMKRNKKGAHFLIMGYLHHNFSNWLKLVIFGIISRADLGFFTGGVKY